jgi:uncharacterized protein involved in exopolysaccharide biosynthesis
MNENELQDDEISLFDLWEKLSDGWRSLAGCLGLGIVGAIAGIVLIEPKYEAIVLIQVGQVGGGQSVEPPGQAIERMRTTTFQRRVAEALNDQKWLQGMARSATGTTQVLSLQMTKGAPLIELRATAESPEIAGRRAEVAVAELIRVHDEMARPALTRLRGDLAIERERLASAEQERLSLTKLMEAVAVKDERFTQLALTTSLRTAKEAETFALRQSITALETALEAPATQSTRAIETLFVPERPVQPKKALLLILGAIGGLLVGVMWVFISDSWRRARRGRTASMA